MRSFLFFVEGVHDINCVARILLINEFKEVSNINDIPEISFVLSKSIVNLWE